MPINDKFGQDRLGQGILGQQLGGRYKVLKVLGAGGFGQTYIAADRQRPGAPQCVLKHLSFSSQNADMLKQARRMFAQEAATLERLGTHEQIPQLLAYFEEQGEFYLVQEFIQGHPIAHEIPEGTSLSEQATLEFLEDVLSILVFVHDEGVIHRDLKPENLIRRSHDRAIVLIDFGAVKTIEAQINPIRYTQSIPVYTTGYAASEQCLGRPQFNSDLYSLGIIAIQCLTGTHPTFLDADPRSGDLLWQNKVTARPELIAILDCMTQYQSSNRYTSAREVLRDLAKLREIQPSQPNKSQTQPPPERSIAPPNSVPPNSDSQPAYTQITQPEPLKPRFKRWKVGAIAASITALFGTALLGTLFKPIALQLTQNGLIPTPIANPNLHSGPSDRPLLPPNTLDNPETQIDLNNTQATKTQDPKAQTAVTIAVVLPFGRFPQAASEVLRGIAQAQTEVNRNGGVSGKPLKILLADDENQPDRATAIAQTLSQDPQILGIVGHGSSDTTLAAAGVYKTQQLVTLAPISSATSLSGFSPYLFRTMPSDRLPARALSQHMTTNLKKRRAVVFFSAKNTYSQSLKTEFKNALFYSNQGEVVTEIDLTPPDFNPAEALKLARAKNAEVLVFANSPSDVDRALLVIQTNRQALPVLGSDALYSDKVRDALNPVTQALTLAVPTQQVGLDRSPFAQSARRLWKTPVTWRSALAYDATVALTRAIATAQSLSPTSGQTSGSTLGIRDQIRSALASPQFQVAGSVGAIRFTETGDPQEAIQLVTLRSNPTTRQPEFSPQPMLVSKP